MNKTSLNIEVDSDAQYIAELLGRLHPKNYDVSDRDGSFTVDVQGKMKFDFQKEQYIFHLNSKK